MNPTIKVLNLQDPTADPNPYVEAVSSDDDVTYNLEDWVKVIAKDSAGHDISDRVVYDASAVDYTKAGDYPVEVSVMDDQFNMSSAFFTVHVLSPKEVRMVESGRPLRRESEVKRVARAEKIERIVDKISYIVIFAVIIGVLIFTYLDAF